MIVLVNSKTRMVEFSKNYIGNDGENLTEQIVFKFDDEFVDGIARLEYQNKTESRYVMLNKDEDSYSIPVKSVMMIKGQVDMQLVITKQEEDDGIPIFKSNKFYVFVGESINAEIEQPEGYDLWIDIANQKLIEIENKVIEINDLEEHIEANEEERVNYINEFKKDVESGKFNGKDGADGKDGKDGYTPVKGIDYFDGKDGLNGRDGTDGRNGIDGRNGTDGYTPIKGIDYFDGKNGTDGRDGRDGTDGKDGINGKNATINGKESIEITAGDNVEITNTENGIEISASASGGDSTRCLKYYKHFATEEDLMGKGQQSGTLIAPEANLSSYIESNFLTRISDNLPIENLGHTYYFVLYGKSTGGDYCYAGHFVDNPNIVSINVKQVLMNNKYYKYLSITADGNEELISYSYSGGNKGKIHYQVNREGSQFYGDHHDEIVENIRNMHITLTPYITEPIENKTYGVETIEEDAQFGYTYYLYTNYNGEIKYDNTLKDEEFIDTWENCRTLTMTDNFKFNLGMNLIKNFNYDKSTPDTESKVNDIATVGENNNIYRKNENGTFERLVNTDKILDDSKTYTDEKIAESITNVLGGSY